MTTLSSTFSPDSFAEELQNQELLSTQYLKDRIGAANKHLDIKFSENLPARELIRLRSNFMDDLLRALWKKYNCNISEHALVACGGFGRRELFPYSDLDILVIVGQANKQQLGEIELFLTKLWDLGLNLGHSVRTIEQCEKSAKEDITILTNLMEARLICGNESSMKSLQKLSSNTNMWPSDEFFIEKLHEQRSRHEKFADTEYNLEPNVKSSPGGLRDIQFIGWIAERFLEVSSLEEVFQKKFVSLEDAKILTEGQEFLWKVRYALHKLAGRDENRLLFEFQRQIAHSWGYTDGNRLAVEKFMQSYYRWVLKIGQLNEILIQHFEQAILRSDCKDSIKDIDANFIEKNGYLNLRQDSLIKKIPSLLLLIFKTLGHHSDLIGPSAKTIQIIRDNIDLIDEDFRENPSNHAIFIEILRSPHRMTLQLRRMNRYGVLPAYLPAFGRIVGQMQHDLFHVYTVDAHTLEVIQNMRRFLNGKYEEKFPVASKVARRLPKIELLYIAGLFHDIGKGRGGDHSLLGSVEAREFGIQHALSKPDIELVAWLVENHLLMSSVAQRKDISDPFVINEFANKVGSENYLDYLFTLTVADITGTNPNLWNAWRASLIRQLYTAARRAIRKGLKRAINKEELALSTQEKAEEILEAQGFSHQEIATLWSNLSKDYFLRENADDIAWHTALIANQTNMKDPLISVRNATDSSVANATKIFIYTKPTSHSFSATCGELEILELSVQDARIYSDDNGMVLYNFTVLNLDGSTLEKNKAKRKLVQKHLKIALSKDHFRPQLIRRRTSRQKKSFRISTKTKFYQDAHQNFSVLEVASRDRPGLLAKIAVIFEEYEILLKAAKIQTLGERVEDTFFITTHKNHPLEDKTTVEAMQSSIRNELDKSLVSN